MSETRESGVFELLADRYRCGRQDYPADLVDWLAEECPDARRVVDLGCGPGTLTRPLRRVFPAVGVDPSRAMLRQLRASGPGPVVAALGEQLPFAAGTQDLIVASQSFHWMDRNRVVPELLRVLRPTGSFVSCWQGWMDAQAPVERLWLRGWHEGLACEPPRGPERPRMEDVEQSMGEPDSRFDAPVAWPLDAAGVVAFLISRAPCGLVGPEQQAELREFWRREAPAIAPLDYTLRIGARLWRRERLEARQGAA